MTIVRAEVFPAGEFLADELEARGWTQAELAEILGRPPQFVSEIIAGKKEITRESAAQLGAALGTSPEMWLEIQDRYFLWRQAQDERTQTSLGEVRVRARLKELAPISILVKRGFIASGRLEEQVEQLIHLYGMPSLESEPDLQIAARRSNKKDELSATQLAWVACVREMARGKEAAAYSKEALESLAARLPKVVRDETAFATLPGLFAECGVTLVYVEAFPSSKIDGCSLLLYETPVIGISGRGKRLDKVLFTLLHEVAHVTLGHLDQGGVIVDDPDDHHTLGVEDEADKLAGEWMIPGKFPLAPARVGAEWVAQVAQMNGVHPILVVGRLQNDHVLNWRTALVKGAPNVDAQLAAWG